MELYVTTMNWLLPSLTTTFEFVLTFNIISLRPFIDLFFCWKNVQLNPQCASCLIRFAIVTLRSDRYHIPTPRHRNQNDDRVQFYCGVEWNLLSSHVAVCNCAIVPCQTLTSLNWIIDANGEGCKVFNNSIFLWKIIRFSVFLILVLYERTHRIATDVENESTGLWILAFSNCNFRLRQIIIWIHGNC